jgi:5-formyltetrahydrofolate cyclo-ligase
VTDLALLKDELRQAALARRDALSPEWRASASVDAALKGIDAMDVRAGAVIAGFLSIRTEIDPMPLMHELATLGANLCLPSIVDRSTIVFRAWKPGDPLRDMELTTRGPLDNAPEATPDIILMPLAAFDSRGNRLGYGGGFYDRAVERLLNRGVRPRLIGLAFACQEVEEIPAEPHDIPISEILTEKGLRIL